MSSAVYVYAGPDHPDEDRNRQNVTTPPANDDPTLKSAKNGLAYCAIVLASIALLLAVICCTAVGVTLLNNNRYLKAGSSDSQVDIARQTTTETPSQCLPPGCPTVGSLTPPQAIPDEAKPGHAVYIRWGRTVCPNSASLVYKGIAGGKWYAHTGSGSNYLCLPEDPEYDEYTEAEDHYSAPVYSVEYQFHEFSPFTGKHNHDAPCAVCQSNKGSSLAMIPAKKTCPDTWTREYYGYLVANWHSHHSTEFVCIDRNPEVRPGSIANHNGALFYPVEGRCSTGNLPCSPYINGAELTCVVCTK